MRLSTAESMQLCWGQCPCDTGQDWDPARRSVWLEGDVILSPVWTRMTSPALGY